jgi:hypothetical protein
MAFLPVSEQLYCDAKGVGREYRHAMTGILTGWSS